MSKQHRSQYRVLDEAARNRRMRQQLEQLERDNFHDDPHANLVMHKKAPKFEDSAQIKTNTSSSRRHHHRPKVVSFSALLEEDMKGRDVNYASAVAPSPDNVLVNSKILFKVPRRHFCSVCGFQAAYTCVMCGMRYCCVNCLQTHRDTRCLKWTV